MIDEIEAREMLDRIAALEKRLTAAEDLIGRMANRMKEMSEEIKSRDAKIEHLVAIIDSFRISKKERFNNVEAETYEGDYPIERAVEPPIAPLSPRSLGFFD
jgi:uncharacterized coiled-coil protein SlyX